MGALLLRALDAAREKLYQKRRATEGALPATDSAEETPTRARQQADAWPCWRRRRCIGSSIPGRRGTGTR